MEKIRWYVGYGVLVFGLIVVGISQYGSAQPATTFASQTPDEDVPVELASEQDVDLDTSVTEAIAPAPETVASRVEAIAVKRTAVETQPTAEDAAAGTVTENGASEPMHQDDEGVFHGQVNAIDLDGKLIPAPNALLKAMKDSRMIAETRSDREGKFEFEGLFPGLYTLDARGAAGTASRSVQIAPTGSSSFSSFPMVLTPFGNTGAIAASGGPASFVSSRRNSGGGGTGGGRTAPTSGGDGGGSSGSDAAGLAALGAAAGLGSGGGGSGGGGSGSGGAVPVVVPDNVSEFEP